MSMARRFKEGNRPPEGTSWCWLTSEMLQSPAWRALTGNAIKIVLRVALEHLAHGGINNGRLPVTYADFKSTGVRHNNVREAIQIAINLGWIERRDPGEVPWHGNIRAPGMFSLTWLPRHDGVAATNRWRRLTTDQHARKAVAIAHEQHKRTSRLPPSFNRQRSREPRLVVVENGDIDSSIRAGPRRTQKTPPA